ncbi:MAG: hypothetical protein M1541_07505 [Acidobacteria bacterium]|nr:hypothetical protein [Acidobacteriota bacterium]
MIYTVRPASGPARRAWTILSTVLGEVLELRFLQEYQGDAAGFWRVRFRDRDTGESRVNIIPAKNIDAVSDERIDAVRKLTKKADKAMRRAEALEQKIIRMKQAGVPEEPGPLTADIVYEKRGRKLVPRLHVRKRRSKEEPPKFQ